MNGQGGCLAASADWEPQHPKGYFQPGVVALSSDRRVLYRWRGVPTRKNMGGAVARPTAEHVWSTVEAALAAPPTEDASHDEAPPLDARGAPWPLFVALLVANGWFVRARGFPHLTDGPPPERRVRNAFFRLLGFAGAWGAALWALPALWVLAAFGLWVAWITPHVRTVGREFQNEAPA